MCFCMCVCVCPCVGGCLGSGLLRCTGEQGELAATPRPMVEFSVQLQAQGQRDVDIGTTEGNLVLSPTQ